jgi:hypothetical protein
MSSEAVHRALKGHRGKNRGDRGAHPETERRFTEEIKGVVENGDVTQDGVLDSDEHRRR